MEKVPGHLMMLIILILGTICTHCNGNAAKLLLGVGGRRPGRRLRTRLPEGARCNVPGREECARGSICKCMALNRGLLTCLRPGALLPPKWARHLERQGLDCEPYLPEGAKPMPPPPSFASGDKVIDPRSAGNPMLKEWAMGPAHGYYTQYILIHPTDDVKNGIPILAGKDVSRETMQKAASTLRHLLIEAPLMNETIVSLANSGVRLLIAGETWEGHPEVSREFVSGLGGGAPWFPSTGIHAAEPANMLAEELFHTIQYTAMSPHQVCMYHKAYSKAVTVGLYTTDGGGEEIDGEPVPTVQADEYLAMALQRWMGSDVASDEYKVPGNSPIPGATTGREQLRHLDPDAFCLVAAIFHSDDTWNPEPTAQPWIANPNRGMDRTDVYTFCQPILHMLANGCPQPEMGWPKDSRSRHLP